MRKIISINIKDSTVSASVEELTRLCVSYVNKARDSYFLGKLEECIYFYHQALDVSVQIFRAKNTVSEEDINNYLKALKVTPKDFETIDLKYFVAEAMAHLINNINQGNRLVFLVGPSLAGKNSAAVILKNNLEKQGFTAKVNDGDDFFKSKPLANQDFFNKPELTKNKYINNVSKNFDFASMILNLEKEIASSKNEIIIIPIMDVIALSFPFEKYLGQFQLIEITSQNLATKDFNKKQFRNFLFRASTKVMLEVKYLRLFNEILDGLKCDFHKFKNYKPDFIFNRSNNLLEIPSIRKTMAIKQPAELIINPFWQIALKKEPADLAAYAKDANILSIYKYWKDRV